jgi:quinohemoprotein ethanol dehydrogenase
VRRPLLLAAAALALSACHAPRQGETAATSRKSAAVLSDASNGANWAATGRTFGEQHFSPLSEISLKNVQRLGLAWSLDLPLGNSISTPLAVDGVVYVATGYSVVRAIDAVTGRELWIYDPKVAETEGARVKMRNGWGIRGLAWWNGKLYVGTHDGRLIALDARSGKPVWSVMTVGKDDVRFISGAPRVFAGKVIIGHGGADIGPTRGYVTTYDAETGKLLWRFYTVPGNPADGFENDAMKMAATTWKGEWWKFGGGGTVWNAMTYDPETDTIFIGTGNGGPWNQHIRSPGGGDNLFLCSIVALDAKTGAYKWHYQINPGETWDYNAAMDMPLATITIDGKPRKVIMEAPKNGFFYVIDRVTGKLISAEPFAKTTWASRIDLGTGRPVEDPAARYPNGRSFELWPSPEGAHNWLPMAFSPKSGLVYIPTLSTGSTWTDKGVDLKTWRWTPGGNNENGVAVGVDATKPGSGESALLAWNPVTQKPAWRAPTAGLWSGGVLATAGDLVFQGQANGRFDAYDATTGRQVWSFDSRAATLAAPITYMAGGHQYVTVLTGAGLSGAIFGDASAKLGWEARTQPRRVLTFRLDGTATLPPRPAPYTPVAPPDPTYAPDPTFAAEGNVVYHHQCYVCHGGTAKSGGIAPDLRASAAPQSAETFEAIVRGGALMSGGMPRFDQLSDRQVAALRQYLRSRARDLAAGR